MYLKFCANDFIFLWDMAVLILLYVKIFHVYISVYISVYPWLDLWSIHIGEKSIKTGTSLVEIGEGMSEIIIRQTS